MCGCDNTTMRGNTYNATYHDPSSLRVIIAHEINQTFYETARKDDPDRHIVLYNALDEGFANLFSMRALNVSKLEAFNMTADEFKWLEENETKLKEKFKNVLFYDKEDDWGPYSQKIPDSITAGSPGDKGYFIGYKIIEQWLKNDDSRQWQDGVCKLNSV